MPDETIVVLGATYVVCLAVFACISAALYVLERRSVWAELTLVWLAGIVVFAIEILSGRGGMAAVALASGSNILFTLALARATKHVSGAPVWLPRDALLLGAGWAAALAAVAFDGPFWLIALPLLPAIVLPLLRALSGFWQMRDELAPVDRVLAVLLLLLVVHKADYVFLRPMEQVAPWGFMVALTLLVATGNVLFAAFARRQEERLERLQVRTARHQRAEEVLRELMTTELRSTHAVVRQKGHFETVGAVAGGVAHDFNNMVNVLLGNVELLMETNPPQNQVARQAYDAVLQSGSRAMALVRQMMEIARDGRGVRRRCSVNDDAESAFGLLHTFRRKGLRLELETISSAHLHMRQGDLSRIIFNLATNAIQAVGASRAGVVQVTVADRRIDAAAGERENGPTGPCVEISVVDNGPGMSDVRLQQLSNPFQTGRAADGGTGLGLFVVRSIVEDLGGQIRVLSSIGKGTTVLVTLPVFGRDDHDTGTQGTRAVRRVLVVDDDADSIDLLTSIVRSLGYQPEPCRTVERALAHVLDPAIHWRAIVTNGPMPGLGSIEMLVAMRRAQPELPVIVVANDAAVRVAAREEGASAVLSAPVDADRLGAALRRATGGSVTD